MVSREERTEDVVRDARIDALNNEVVHYRTVALGLSWVLAVTLCAFLVLAGIVAKQKSQRCGDTTVLSTPEEQQ